MANALRVVKSHDAHTHAVTMDLPPDGVRVEIEHLSGEILLEVKLEVKTADFVGSVRGSKMTWIADGLRITIPAALVEAHREFLLSILDPERATSPSDAA